MVLNLLGFINVKFGRFNNVALVLYGVIFVIGKTPRP